MSQFMTELRVDALVERLARGAELLFEMEQRGETDARYTRWLAGWTDLLTEYEVLDAVRPSDVLGREDLADYQTGSSSDQSNKQHFQSASQPRSMAVA